MPEFIKYFNTNYWKAKVNLIEDTTLFYQGQDNYPKTPLILTISKVDLGFKKFGCTN